MNTTENTTTTPLNPGQITAICHDALLPEGVTVAKRRSPYKILLYKDDRETWQEVQGFTIHGLGIEAFYYPDGRNITHAKTGKVFMRVQGKERTGARYNVFSALWNLRARLGEPLLAKSFLTIISEIESPEVANYMLQLLDQWKAPQ